MITIELIKENIKCPQFGDLEYGKWGALRFEQRKAYKYLIDIVEDLEQENKQLKDDFDFNLGAIENLRKENHKLEDRIDKAIEYIKHSQSYGTMAQVMPHLKPYVNGDDLLQILGDKENE